MDIGSWYRKYGEAVHRRLLRLTRNPTLAWDLTQEVFLRAHRYRDSYQNQGSSLAWLMTIADRCFFDSKPKAELVGQEDFETFLRDEREGTDEVFSRQELVAKLLGRAPRDVRQIVVHRYFDELENEQIADRMGIHEKTVRRKLEKFLENARKFVRRS
jgi:RNA polymerase sigma factor (sigma-70 family)